ncbi:hypothetical protein [uncultured Pseudomonas sp.]|uniref:DUF4376 domain-containing protein n=1 Tax=uncultured Pseudomonas sp. TaxID=114707 RepID=UPI0025D0E646|nr:hypothetical protein [uncultured Pseudomonas sp.]
MKYFVSRSTGGLYLSQLHAQIPDDATEITQEQYEAFKGQSVIWSDSGVPSLYKPEHDKEVIRAAIAGACNATILEGFISTALGAEHRYPAKLTDQSNLQASVLESLFPGLDEDWTTPFWCQDAAGTWAYRPHSAAQIQRVGSDGKAAINACIRQKIQLEEQLAKAQTLAEVEAITWTAPQ